MPIEQDRRYPALLESYRAAGQEHIFRYWDRLDETRRLRLLDQAEALDLDLVSELRNRMLGTNDTKEDELAPLPVLDLNSEPEGTTRAAARELGEDLLRSGKVGIFLVAGGQGSRLGYEGPKGCFPCGPLSQRSIFEMHAAKIRRLRTLYGSRIPWYIMTSSQNDADTRRFFEGANHFGLPPEDVLFLPQGMLPAIDLDGRLILKSESDIFQNPNGHGGAFAAFAEEGGMEHAKSLGLEHIFYFQVDNILIRMIDPLFLGLHAQARSSYSLKVLEKTGPDEKIGVVATRGSRPNIVEYSDLSSKQASLRDAEGRLVFWAGSIAIHMFRLDFLDTVARGDVELPYHVAKKAIESIGDTARDGKIEGCKFERFIFDALPAAERYFNFEVIREQEFAPVKNRSGVDSLVTAQELLMAEHRRWLATIDIRVDGRLEISAIAAIGPEDLEGELEEWRGQTIEGDVIIERDSGGEVVLRKL